jgi:hypothetical protein
MQVDNLERVFRVEAATRRQVSEVVLSELDESCLFSKFLSPVVSGFVCFDVENRALSMFYESERVQDVVAEE